MVRGVEKAMRMARSPSLKPWNATPPTAPAAPPPEHVKRWIEKTVHTTYHYAGTCRMGEDARAPVTTDLRVRGVNGLRVADASAIPSTPVAAVNAPSMLIGYRAALAIRTTRSAQADRAALPGPS